MNAYELAGRLLEKKLYLIQEGVNSSYLEDASNMLRQQADRIAELEKEAEECWCGGHSYEYLKAKNRLPQEKQSEPVAWMAEHFDGRKRVEIAGFAYDQDAGWGHKRIPLYTTPQTKPLSDEEINQIIKQQDWFSMTWVDMVRRIERIIKEKNEPTNR